MEAGAHPAEPIICLDDLQSEEALRHPLEQAVETVVEAFVDSEPVRYLARPGHEQEYMRAVLRLSRSEQQYEVHEAGDFGCVALVHEVPPPAAAAPSESGGESEDSEDDAAGTAGAEGAEAGRHPPPPTSRAEASANVEPAAKHDLPKAAGGSGSLRYDSVQLRAAAEDGSLDALMAMGVPRLEAELLLHVRPDRLREMQQVLHGLDAAMQQYAQEHGPLLHLHFLATRPSERGLGRGQQLLHHLERMADAEGRRLYLEATSPHNRRLYLRHGFHSPVSNASALCPPPTELRDVGEYRVGGEQEGLAFYLMVRPPGARSLPASAADLQAAAGEPAGSAAAGGDEAARGKAAAVAGEGTLLRDEM
ncbi:hypothetical protein COHA_002220 [Chlorella ohadii]|uniref:N-acetyltransferase domain-containing protein n=1 Tax=Chlorella ohadii TaxID=2649997 RepID=A0AAD5DVS0_9CHLO|nr:hypothetical protein COHA_002220 [Chlorella ohadii]